MGPSPHLCFCGLTTATLWPELIVSNCPRPHLSLCACKTAWLAPVILVSMCPRPHLSFCACKTTLLASELLVSMGPTPHLWLLHATQRLQDKIYRSLWVQDRTYGLFAFKTATFSTRMCKSLWVPALICGLCMQNIDFSTRIASLYGSQPSYVVLCIHNSDIMTRINCPYGFQTSPVVLCMHNSMISIRISSLNESQPSSVVYACKTVTFGSEVLVSMGPSPHLRFMHAKRRILDQNYKSLWVPDFACWFVHAKQCD